jgi:hypothetical protein
VSQVWFDRLTTNGEKLTTNGEKTYTNGKKLTRMGKNLHEWRKFTANGENKAHYEQGGYFWQPLPSKIKVNYYLIFIFF